MSKAMSAPSSLRSIQARAGDGIACVIWLDAEAAAVTVIAPAPSGSNVTPTNGRLVLCG